jgi:DNA-binding response OmpR family regulator
MSWTAKPSVPPLLKGSRVLVVEDDAVIALQMDHLLTEAGAAVVGPARTVEEALSLVRDEPLSAAVLDVRVRDQNIQPVADALCDRDIPFLFYSGQVKHHVPLHRWPKAFFIAKPTPSRELIEAVRQVLESRRELAAPRAAAEG